MQTEVTLSNKKTSHYQQHMTVVKSQHTFLRLMPQVEFKVIPEIKQRILVWAISKIRVHSAVREVHIHTIFLVPQEGYVNVIVNQYQRPKNLF